MGTPASWLFDDSDGEDAEGRTSSDDDAADATAARSEPALATITTEQSAEAYPSCIGDAASQTPPSAEHSDEAPASASPVSASVEDEAHPDISSEADVPPVLDTPWPAPARRARTPAGVIETGHSAPLASPLLLALTPGYTPAATSTSEPAGSNCTSSETTQSNPDLCSDESEASLPPLQAGACSTEAPSSAGEATEHQTSPSSPAFSPQLPLQQVLSQTDSLTNNQPGCQLSYSHADAAPDAAPGAHIPSSASGATTATPTAGEHFEPLVDNGMPSVSPGDIVRKVN